MDDFDLAQQLVKSLYDAENNEQEELVTALRAGLAEVNSRLIANGWAPVGVEEWGSDEDFDERA